MSDALLRNYLENAPDGIYMVDMKGNVPYGNRKAEAMTGCDRSELVGDRFSELSIMTEKSMRRAFELPEESNKGRSTGPDQFEVIDRGGPIAPVEIFTSVVQYEDRHIVPCFLRDITERKQTTQALYESEERCRLLPDALVRTILAVDENAQSLIFPQDAVGRLMRCSLDRLVEGAAVFPFLTKLPEALSWEEVVQMADACLYAAKRSGRNAWIGVLPTDLASIEDIALQLNKRLPDLVAGGKLDVQTSLPNVAMIIWPD